MTAATKLEVGRGVDRCRSCGEPGLTSVLDLGRQPLANSLLTDPGQPDPTFPLHLRACPTCGLGQVGEYVTPETIFSDYPYLSSMSTSWLRHVASFADQMVDDLRLSGGDLVVEVASNDGHLLKEFLRRGTQVLGVEPAGNVAALAEAAGVPTTCAFFGLATARALVAEHGSPRLVVANNVLAHVPDINDFMAGLAYLCGPDSLISVENPTFTGLLRAGLFDTIYHEHYSYLSAHAVKVLAESHHLRLVGVETLSTHGGSYRYFLARHDSDASRSRVHRAIETELSDGLLDPGLWADFAARSRETIASLRGWLDELRLAGRRVVGYGAPAKGNTLLNAAGATTADLLFVTDRSAEKQGRYLPGSHIPVRRPDDLASSRATDILVLPWNIAQELSQEISALSDARQWVAIPRPTRIGQS